MSPAEETVFLPSVNPVKNVKESVESKSCNVVRGDILNNSDFVEHNNLRDESETFKP